jgi:hypothetical protein
VIVAYRIEVGEAALKARLHGEEMLVKEEVKSAASLQLIFQLPSPAEPKCKGHHHLLPPT